MLLVRQAQQVAGGGKERPQRVKAAFARPHGVLKARLATRPQADHLLHRVRRGQLDRHALLQAQPDHRQQAGVAQVQPHRDLFSKERPVAKLALRR